jgi:wyosine [tRNA(Phe)-imidazoG37] synthetase (radical SAM superfamily)
MKYRCIFCWLGEFGRERIDKSEKPEKVKRRREIGTEKVEEETRVRVKKSKEREWFIKGNLDIFKIYLKNTVSFY